MSRIVFNNDKIGILRSLVNSNNVSFGAIGLMIYFINNEDEDIKIKNVSSTVKECASSVGKYISELKAAGYLSIRRNIIDCNGKIEMIYYICNSDKYNINSIAKSENEVYTINYSHALKKCKKFSCIKSVSLSHLGAWYIIESSTYKKQRIPIDEISYKLNIKTKHFYKYIKSYNKLNRSSIENEFVKEKNHYECNIALA